MKKKNILYIVGTIIIIILLGLSLFNQKNINKQDLKKEKDLISVQYEKEKEFKIKGYTLDNPNIILNPYTTSPLSALVLFETENEEEVKVTIKGKDKLSTFSHTFPKEKNHYITVYGLYPDYDNEVILECDNHIKTINIKTDKLPEGFILPISVEADKKSLNNDLYFFTPSSVGFTCAFDVNGDVRWYLTKYALWDNVRLKNGHMIVSTDRLVDNPYYTTGFYEIDLLGKVYNEYSLDGGYHHDYFEMPNGNFLVLSNDFLKNECGTVEDIVVELDRKTGNIVKTFDLKDMLDMDDGKGASWVSYDWFHANSVWYDENTNSIIVSGRHKDAVIDFNYDTGKINWIIGDSTNWKDKYQKYFFKPVGDNFEWQWAQHAAMVTPEGYIFILDNGNNKSKIKEKFVPADKSYTRGVMYKIDTDKMTIKQVWEYGKERGYKFYSPYISDVDYIAKNHYLIHSGGISYVNGKISNRPAGLVENSEKYSDTVELLNDKVIFEIVFPANIYRAEKQSLYTNETFSLGKGKHLGKFSKTKINEKEYVFSVKSLKMNEEYNSHNIKFLRENDRLMFSGDFKKTDKVKLVLYKNFKTYKYDIPISFLPYTVLCVNVFPDVNTKDEMRVNRYINNTGMDGKYAIYVEINNKLYNTEMNIVY